MSTENFTLDKKRKIKQLIEVLRRDTRNVNLWLELESLFDDPDKKREILMGVLVIDAQNPEALERLGRLTGAEKSSFAAPDLSDRPRIEREPALQKDRKNDELNGGWKFEDPALSSENGENADVETRKCPFCGELINRDAVRCQFCHKDLESSLQERVETVSHQDEETEFSGWLKTAIILFIVLGVLTVLAMFIWMIIPLIQ